MTANGWLQIVFFLLVVLALTKPLGVFMTRVFNRERTFLDPVLRPLERLIYRVTGVDEDREMDWKEYAVSMLLFSGVSMVVLYLLQRVQGMLPFNPQKLAQGSSRSGLQHRGLVYHQHQLAGLHAGNHHELSDPDGRAGVPQLHFGGGRHRAGHRPHSRHCPPREEDDRQLLGGPGPLHAMGAAAVSASSARWCWCRRAYRRT